MTQISGDTGNSDKSFVLTNNLVLDLNSIFTQALIGPGAAKRFEVNMTVAVIP